MKLEIQIQSHVNLLRLRWPVVNLLGRIERFDAIWPSLEKQETKVFNALRVTTIDQNNWLSAGIDNLFLPELENCSDAAKTEALTNFQDLIFWYETNMEIHALIKAILFGFYLQLISPSQSENQTLGLKATVIKLIELGCSWVTFINWLPVDGLEINEWVFYFLSALRDEQEILLHKMDLGGVRQKMTSSEQLLLHIIEQNDEMQTTGISKKLGKSLPTTRRMLSKMVERNLIERKGTGPATYYKPI